MFINVVDHKHCLVINQVDKIVESLIIDNQEREVNLGNEMGDCCLEVLGVKDRLKKVKPNCNQFLEL